MKQSREAGEVNPLLITNIISGLLVVILTGLMIWLFMGYNDYKNNADQKVTVAVDKAKKDQQKTDETAFLEREKVPTRTFTGPSDLGSVSFQYPKTWSTYVAKQSLELEAYLHPDFVPPVSNTQPFAIRVVVEDRSYDTVLKNYEPLVKRR
jgi:cytoskeletal protein RodZ